METAGTRPNPFTETVPYDLRVMDAIGRHGFVLIPTSPEFAWEAEAFKVLAWEFAFRMRHVAGGSLVKEKP